MDILFNLISIAFSILFLILLIKIWGMANDVRAIKNKYLADSSPVVSSSAVSEAGNFSVGDLVIIKDTEDQFRIGGIDKSDTGIHYYKNESSPKWEASQIEHFDVYWKDKKK